MFSERLRRFSGPLAVAFALLMALTACGRKGDPQPPPRKNPERVANFQIQQTGQELILSMGYPTMTTGGLALPGISKLEIVQFTRPAPEFMDRPEDEEAEGDLGDDSESAEPIEGEATEAEPDSSRAQDSAKVETEEIDPQASEVEAPESELELTDEQMDEGEDVLEIEETEPINPFLSVRIDSKEFDKQADMILVLEGEELESAVVGGKIIVRLPLDEITVEPPTAYAFAVEAFAGRLRSPRSQVSAFVPLPPPPAPTDLAARASGAGITLSWVAVEDEASIEGYRILRRLSRSPDYQDALATVEPGVTEYLDGSASYDQTYVYTITAMRMEKPLVESTQADETEVEHRDAYPPKAPTGVVALAEAGRIRLLWDEGLARDIVGYLVFVSTDGGDPQQLTPEPLDATEFTHEGTTSQTTYTYTILAVDDAGNMSAASSEVTARSP